MMVGGKDPKGLLVSEIVSEIENLTMSAIAALDACEADQLRELVTAGNYSALGKLARDHVAAHRREHGTGRSQELWAFGVCQALDELALAVQKDLHQRIAQNGGKRPWLVYLSEAHCEKLDRLGMEWLERALDAAP